MTVRVRYDFVYLFDVTNGNPNGDPDANNMPRLDPETGSGLVTDVCLKRKLRNYVSLTRAGNAGFEIYVQEGAILNDQHRRAYSAVRESAAPSDDRVNPRDDGEAAALRRWLCANFFDIRCFGAVMSTGVNCGQVRGPVQLTFAQSIDPVFPVEVTVTRMASTNEQLARKKTRAEADEERSERRTMGRKYIVPYGLYRAHGFVSAHLAARTGFSNDDLDLFFEGLSNMFDLDRSASRGQMVSRRLVTFRHSTALGNAPAHELQERLRVCRRLDGLDGRPARTYADYLVTLDQTNLPEGVTIEERI